MTEQEWLQATNPTQMLEFLRGMTSDRKLRLLAVACCRRIWHHLTDPRSRRAVEMAERYADGLTTSQAEMNSVEQSATQAGIELHEAGLREAAMAAGLASHSVNVRWGAFFAAKMVVAFAPGLPVLGLERDSLDLPEVQESVRPKVRQGLLNQADLLRDVSGPLPFHSIVVDPAWLTWHGGLLVSMAQKMYDSRDFADMSVLADALEEAGCTNPDILAHCRSGGEHVRGCWVIDALLGKS
jgi:hypothetical protein